MDVTARVIVLALIASGFTPPASVAQRRAAALAPEKMSFSVQLVGYLLRRPAWFVGIASMIAQPESSDLIPDGALLAHGPVGELGDNVQVAQVPCVFLEQVEQNSL